MFDDVYFNASKNNMKGLIANDGSVDILSNL